VSTINAAIGLPGAHEALRTMDQANESMFSYDALANLMIGCGAREVDATVDALMESNLVHRAAQGFEITHLGRKASLLLDAINGADLREVWRRLGHLDPTLRNYELVRNKLTEEFLRSFVTRPSFGRLYLCSPWISFDRYQQGLIAHAVLQAERSARRPEILVVTRPERRATNPVPPAAQYLQRLGAVVYLNRNLHSKLYIREPNQGGGYLMAILGSQNLTKSTYLELGIKIHSDTTVIQNLIGYFFDIASQSDEA